MSSALVDLRNVTLLLTINLAESVAQTVTNTSHNDPYYKTKHFSNPVHGHVVASLYEHIYVAIYLQYKIAKILTIIHLTSHNEYY